MYVIIRNTTAHAGMINSNYLSLTQTIDYSYDVYYVSYLMFYA